MGVMPRDAGCAPATVSQPPQEIRGSWASQNLSESLQETGRRESPGDNAQPVRCDGGWMPSFLDFPTAQFWHVPRESLSQGLRDGSSTSPRQYAVVLYSFLTSVPSHLATSSHWCHPPVTPQSLFRVYSFEDPRLRQWEFCNNSLFFSLWVWL